MLAGCLAGCLADSIRKWPSHQLSQRSPAAISLAAPIRRSEWGPADLVKPIEFT